jgi:hypothetical protein
MGIYDRENNRRIRVSRRRIVQVEVFQVKRGSMYQLGEKMVFGGAVDIRMGLTGDSFT